jgi:hypothetical protein
VAALRATAARQGTVHADVPVVVDVKDRGGQTVCRAPITMRVAPRKKA